MLKKNILTICLVALLLIGVLTSGCIGEEKSSISGEQVAGSATDAEKAAAAQPTTASAAVSEWESDKADANLVKVVNFLLKNKGKEIEVAGEKHEINGKEKLDIVAKMCNSCPKEKLNELMTLTVSSLDGEVKSSNLDERLWHASVPADKIQTLDAVWNVEKIDLEPEARAIWMEVVSSPATTQPPTTVPPTTEPPSTTQPPEISKTTTPPTTTTAPATTSPPTITPWPTTAPSLWTQKPALVISQFEGSKTFEIEVDQTVQVEDALIYHDAMPTGCDDPWSELSIYKSTDEGGVREGAKTYYLTGIERPKDITEDIHKISNTLDDYTIVVENWPGDKIQLTLTYVK